jgi:hypothetical protein
MEEGIIPLRIPPLHRANLFSAFHAACTPVNIVASFINARIISRLSHEGIPAGYIGPDICRCLLQDFYVTSIGEPSEIESRVDEHLTDDGDSDIDAALCLSILDEQTANFLDSDE